jgi:SAM-dependent methyltransferase
MPRSISEMYADYWSRPEFQQVYQGARVPLYKKMAEIAAEVQAQTVLDVGCAYGQFVDFCNTAGMDAWGVDLPVPQLMEHHRSLERSQGRFFYGAIEEPALWDKISSLRPWDLITCIDTIVHLPDPASLVRLRARYYLVKTDYDNRRNRKQRQNQNDFRLWSPCDLAALFQGYAVRRIYLPRFRGKFNNPPRWLLRWFNAFMPSYVVLLARTQPEPLPS